MDKFRVTNLDKYQKYDRNKAAPPPWIKIYSKVLSDQKICALDDVTFGHLCKIWIVASQHDNVLPFDPRIIRKMIVSDNEPNLNQLLELGLIDLYTSCRQSVDNLYTSCSTREGGREGREGDKKGRGNPRSTTKDQKQTPVEMIVNMCRERGTTPQQVEDETGIYPPYTRSGITAMKKYLLEKPKLSDNEMDRRKTAGRDSDGNVAPISDVIRKIGFEQ